MSLELLQLSTGTGFAADNYCHAWSDKVEGTDPLEAEILVHETLFLSTIMG